MKERVSESIGNTDSVKERVSESIGNYNVCFSW